AVAGGGATGRRALVGGRQTRRPGGRRQGTPSDPACSRGARASFLHEEANSFTHSQTESDTLFVVGTAPRRSTTSTSRVCTATPSAPIRSSSTTALESRPRTGFARTLQTTGQHVRQVGLENMHR